ncbi:MAG: hypothetical protein ABI602_05100, partial [Candidatus Saccharibacteria bacterium]
MGTRIIRRTATASRVGRIAFASVMGLALIFAVGSSLLRPASSAAATGDTVNFQARLEGSNGAIALDGNYNVQFKLYNVSSGGSALWTESDVYAAGAGNDHRIRVVNGYLTVNLGATNAFPGTINWSQDMYITMNIGGTTTTTSYDGEMNPRLKLTAVPYAFSAGQLSTVSGANSTKLDFVTPTASNSILLPDASGTVCLANSVACGFASLSGSTSYIQNGTSLQSTANFNIQSTSTGSVAGIVEALTGQTADLLQFRDASAAALSGIDVNGQLYYQSGSFTGTLVQDTMTQSTVYHLPAVSVATATICLSTGNCAGAGGSITGAGTINYVARFNTSGSINSSSLLYDDGSFIGVNTTTNSALLSVVSSNASQVGAFVQAATSATVPAMIVKAGATPASGSSLISFQDSAGTELAVVASNGDIATNSTLAAGTTSPSGASNLEIHTTATGMVGALVQGSVSQTANLLQLQDSNGNINAAFSANGSQLTLGRIASSGTVTQGNLILSDGTTSNYGLTLVSGVLTANSTVTVPNAGGNDQVCLLNLANCVGSGGGITGAGVQNYISKFDTLGGNHLSSSLLYDNGSFVGVNTTTNSGLLTLQGASTTQSTLFAQGTTSSSVTTAIIQAGTSQSGNLLDIRTSAGANLVSVNSAGAVWLGQTGATAYVGGNVSPSVGPFSASLVIGTSATNIVGQIIRGVNGQTADLFQGQDNSGNVLTSISASGAFSTAASGDAVYSQNGNVRAGQSLIADHNLTVNNAGANAAGSVVATIKGSASQTANLLQLQDSSNAIVASIGATGNLTVASSADSSFAGKLGIGTTTPGFKLDVQGGSGVVGNFSGRVAGADAAANNEFVTLGQANAAYATGSGNNNYIQNQSAIAQTANFFVQTSNATVPTAVLAATLSQTSDLLQLQNSVGAVLAKVDVTGNLTAVNGTFTGTLVVTGAGSFVGTLTANGDILANGNITQSGTGTFSSGTGAITLNGNTSITGTSTLSVGTGATSIGGILGVTGLTTLSGGVSVNGASAITGALNINTTGTATTAIGNTGAAFSLASSGLNISTAGAVTGVTTLTASGALTAATSGNTINGLVINSGSLSGITGFNQASGNFAISGAGSFSTGSGAISLNGNTNVTGSRTLTTGTGAVTLGSLGAGVVQSDASGLLSSGNITVSNGGTGTTTFTANGILYGNGTGAIQSTAAAADSILFTNGSGIPGLTQTLPTAVQGNITSTGVLAAGSIVSGFGAISTANNITTTANIQGATLNAIGALQLGGLDINTAGTLTNVAYLNQANSFSAANTFSAAGTALAVSNDASIGGTGTIGALVVTGNATLGGSLTVTAASTLNGNVAIAGTSTLTVGTGATTLGGSLAVAGTSTLTGLLTANGGILTAGNFSQTGATTFDTGTGTVSLNGATTVTGTNTFTVGTGATTLGGALGVTGNSAFGGTTATTGAANFDGGVTVDNNSNFAQTGSGSFGTGTGAVSLNGNTLVSGTNTLTVGTGATTLGGTLGVTGATTLSGTLAVAAASTFNGNVAISSTSTLTVGTGATTLGGTLVVTGATTLSGLLTANGGITDTGNFAQTGAGTFGTGTGAVSLNGATSITGSNSFTTGSGAVTLGALGAGVV